MKNILTIFSAFQLLFYLPFLIPLLLVCVVKAKNKINKGSLGISNLNAYIEIEITRMFYKSQIFNFIFSALVWILIYVTI